MDVTAWRSKSFNGGVFHLTVKYGGEQVLSLVNRSFAVDAVLIERKLFDALYEKVEITPNRLRRILEGMKQAALSKGMTVRAADVLPKLVALTKEEVKMATENGSVAEIKILQDAEREYKKDGAPKGKAPRKLAGAALKAYEARLAREAAAKTDAAASKKSSPKKKTAPKSQVQQEVEALAADVTTDLQHQEAVIEKRSDEKAKDLTLTKTGAAKMVKDPKAKEKVAAAAKATEKPKRVNKAAVEGFKPESLKNKAGAWRSSSAMMKGLIWAGEKDDKKLFAKVQKEFPDLSDDKFGYVAWNRGWFKRNGIKLPA